MKGLLLKEFYVIRGQIKLWAILYLFFIGLTFISDNYFYLCMISVIITIFVTTNMLSFDQVYKWDMFLRCLPVRITQVISSQYLVIFLVAVSVFLLNLLCGAVILPHIESGLEVGAMAELMITNMSCFLVTLLLAAVWFLLAKRFGLEKARYLLMAVSFGPAILIFGLKRLRLLPALPFADMTDEQFFVLLILSTLLVFLFYGASCLLSIRICSKKEY